MAVGTEGERRRIHDLTREGPLFPGRRDPHQRLIDLLAATSADRRDDVSGRIDDGIRNRVQIGCQSRRQGEGMHGRNPVPHPQLDADGARAFGESDDDPVFGSGYDASLDVADEHRRFPRQPRAKAVAV